MIKKRYIIKASVFNHRYNSTSYYGTKHAQSWDEAVIAAKNTLIRVQNTSKVYDEGVRNPSSIVSDHLNKYGRWEMLCENGDRVEVDIIRKLNKEEWTLWINNELQLDTLGFHKNHDYQLNK